MPCPVLLGPLLGYESDTRTGADTGRYTLTLLLAGDGPAPVWRVGVHAPSADAWRTTALEVTAKPIGRTTSGTVWKATVDIPFKEAEQQIDYRVEHDGAALSSIYDTTDWSFRVPALSQKPRVMFCSCNGFSKGQLARDTQNPYFLWGRAAAREDRAHLLIMGGDQIYADEVFGNYFHDANLDKLNLWREATRQEMLQMECDEATTNALRRLYEGFYLRGWSDLDPATGRCRQGDRGAWKQRKDMAHMLASVPSVMMWDDHDIFDGWGSYDVEMQKSAVFQAIYQVARDHFELFQLRGRDNGTRLGDGHYSLQLRMLDLHCLLLDGRSQRTQYQIFDDAHWTQLKAALTDLSAHAAMASSKQRLLVVTGVPVIYRDFHCWVEQSAEAANMELKDDLLDHWNHYNHEQEKAALLYNLFDAHRDKLAVTLLAGDVHVGAVGCVDRAGQRIHQVIASGIVHPAPSALEWTMVKNTSAECPPTINNGELTFSMLRPTGHPDKFLVARNYATLQEGTDGKLWVNWFTESSQVGASIAID